MDLHFAFLSLLPSAEPADSSLGSSGGRPGNHPEALSRQTLQLLIGSRQQSDRVSNGNDKTGNSSHAIGKQAKNIIQDHQDSFHAQEKRTDAGKRSNES